MVSSLQYITLISSAHKTHHDMTHTVLNVMLKPKYIYIKTYIMRNKHKDIHNEKYSKIVFYIPFNSQSHTGTGAQHLSLVGVEPPHTEVTACN